MIAGINTKKRPADWQGVFVLFQAKKAINWNELLSHISESRCGATASFSGQLAFEGPAAVVFGDRHDQLVFPCVQVNGDPIIKAEDSKSIVAAVGEGVLS